MEFLAFIGVVALLIAGKFIYDTYITNNTETNWEKYQKSNTGISGSVERNKVASYIFLANNLKCAPEQVEGIYIADLRKKVSSSSEVLELARSWKNEKYDQSKQLNISPDDTPASLLETWTMSVFNELQRSENLLNKNRGNEEKEQDEDEDEDEDEYGYGYENEYEEDEDNEEIEDEVDEDEEIEDEYDEEEDDYGKINVSGLRGIEVKKSQWDDVVEAFGLPDKVQDHNGFSVEMIYNNVGLSFYIKIKSNTNNRTIGIIEVNKKFKKYFPKLNESEDNNITLNTIMQAYGQGKMSTCLNASKESYIELKYPKYAIEFSSCYFKNYVYDKESLKLRSAQIGSF